MNSDPTLLMIPCFAGAPWQLDQLHHLKGRPMRTMRLPERLDDLEKLADLVLAQPRDLDSHVLVGDSLLSRWRRTPLPKRDGLLWANRSSGLRTVGDLR